MFLKKCLFQYENQFAVEKKTKNFWGQFQKFLSSPNFMQKQEKSFSKIRQNCKRGGIHNISGPVSLAISHRRNMFPLILRSAGQPIPSTVYNPKRVDLVVGRSVSYYAACP